ncbi:MAG TPA: hypothetical protein VFH58_15050 [Acidimicrobiales bacterium]|nr:hypothetical protein [Acidimicrobiales bacterium]
MEREAPGESEPRRVELGRGRVLEVRPVAAGDVDGLSDLYDTLDPEDRRTRFFTFYRPGREFFVRMASVQERGGFGLVAVEDPDGPAPRIVGEASYNLLPNGDGELGITVAAGWRGWLGPYLVAALCEAAAARGVTNLEADVLIGNGPMLAVLRARGAANMAHPDWTVARVLIGTHGDAPSWPGPHDRPRVLVETPGGRWAAEEAARQAGIDVIVCSGPTRRRLPCPALEGRPCPLAAAADAIVACPEPRDEEGNWRPEDDAAGETPWERLVGAHGVLHGGVPLCVTPAGRPASELLVQVEDVLARSPVRRR